MGGLIVLIAIVVSVFFGIVYVGVKQENEAKGIDTSKDIFPGLKPGEKIDPFLNNTTNTAVPKEPMFTEEEILGADLYPDDDGYRMAIISEILNQ